MKLIFPFWITAVFLLLSIFLVTMFRSLLSGLSGSRRFTMVIAFFLCHSATVLAQVPLSAKVPAPPVQTAPVDTSTPPQAISIADVAVQTESALAQIRRMENRTSIADLIDAANDDIPGFVRESAFRTREMRQLLRKNTGIDALRNMGEIWRDLELRADAVTRDLTQGALQLDTDLQDLAKLSAVWDATSKAAAEAQAPPEVTERVRDVVDAIAGTRKQILADRGKVLALQSKSAEIVAQTSASRQIILDANERAVARLSYRDSPPLWTQDFWSAWINSFSKENREDLVNQGTALIEYVTTHVWNLASHLVFFLLLCGMLSTIRSKVHVLSQTDGSLRRMMKVFDMPVVSAMLIAMLVSTWFYPRPPRMMWVVISAVGAAPVLAFVRRVIDESAYPVLYAIVGFYLVDKLRLVFAPLPGVSRLMLLAETVMVLLMVLWTLRRSAPAVNAPAWTQARIWKILRFGSRLAFLIFMVALAANVGGFVRLADLVASMALGSAYSAVILYALTRVGEGVLQGLMYVPPASLLGMVQRKKLVLTHRINRWLRGAAGLFWLFLTVQATGMLPQLVSVLQSAWSSSLAVGSLTLSVGSIISFFFIFWAAYTLSRLARFILEEEIFPKVRLDRGLPYAVSTMLHYAVLFSGLVLALGAIGVDMTKFTIVAGAFSVGIGFGLQNIVNNFVSGLIVLFERPIKVGDTIQIDDIIGRVEHIGIRASVMRSTAGSEVIIPNGKLISDKVINWTLSNQMRHIAVPIITKPDVNVVELKKVLLEIARQNKLVADAPPPEALFIKRNIDSFEFELRVWTNELDAWLEVRSDLITEVNEALRQNEIAAQAPVPAPVLNTPPVA